jgi:beta-lactamase superfamily II metal-dependent hydrolase
VELWQLPPQTRTQNMSYVLRSSTGEVIVVEGGNPGDADYLEAFLARAGGRVHAWFLSHPHVDHVGAIQTILRRGRIVVDRIYGSLPDLAWARRFEASRARELSSLLVALDATGRVVDEARLGDRLDVGGLHLDVLGVRNPEIVSNAINNSSLVLRVSASNRSILFLGDLGLEGGQKLLLSPLAGRLTSDVVQMAHHGQAGVSRLFYAAVRPQICLWPTPKWLWDNDAGRGPGTGKWLTQVVRAEMDQLGVARHLVAWQGLEHLS